MSQLTKRDFVAGTEITRAKYILNARLKNLMKMESGLLYYTAMLWQQSYCGCPGNCGRNAPLLVAIMKIIKMFCKENIVSKSVRYAINHINFPTS